MNSTSLKQLLPQLKAQKFAGKSDDELIAYIRIYNALYNLVSINSLDAEYGEAAVYKRKLATLYRTLSSRFYKRTTLAEKAKILDALYSMAYSALQSPLATPQDIFDETASVINSYLCERIGEEDKNTQSIKDASEKSEASESTFSIADKDISKISQSIEDASAGANDLKGGKAGESPVANSIKNSQSIADASAGANDLKGSKAEVSPVSNSTKNSQSIEDASAESNPRCIADARSSAVKESPADDTEYYIMRLIMMQWYGFIDEGIIPTDLKYVRAKMQDWSRTQSADGKWNGITVKQALRRIDILNLNADFTSDPTHNEAIKKAYTAYYTPASENNYELVYDLTRDVTTIGTDIPSSLNEITSNLPQTFASQALQIENTCHHIAREVQSTLFEE